MDHLFDFLFVFSYLFHLIGGTFITSEGETRRRTTFFIETPVTSTVRGRNTTPRSGESTERRERKRVVRTSRSGEKGEGIDVDDGGIEHYPCRHRQFGL